MEAIQRWFQRRPSYEPLLRDTDENESEDVSPDAANGEVFSWFDYTVFLLVGIAMLWAWNMFLAAGPYFQRRFESSAWILKNFQAAELSISSLFNLGVILILTHLQSRANYPKRILGALIINMISFTLLAISTRLFTSVSAEAYFVFVLGTVLAASVSTALCQNGVFAYASSFGRKEYPQGIMTGNAIAGVLPPIAQIVSVMSVPKKEASSGVPQESSTSAFSYFMTATVVCFLTLVAFVWLLLRHNERTARKHASLQINTSSDDIRKAIPLMTLLSKLRWLGGAVFMTFAVTMVFPVYTQKIESVHPGTSHSLTQLSSFIPLAFLFWNAGDLVGRLLTGVPALRMTRHPKTLFVLSILRVVFVPMYLLCNISGKGAKISSDFFYLVVVQFLFGTTNGFVGSTCMMGAVDWLEPEEREAAGGFMGLCLVGGLTVGSLFSFLVVPS